MDGALYSSLKRHMVGRHELFYARSRGFDHGDDHDVLWAPDWTITLKCIAHACSNAVLWGLKPNRITELSEDVHVSIASLQNGRTALHSKTDMMLVRHLEFRGHRSGSDSDISTFWLFLTSSLRCVASSSAWIWAGSAGCFM